MLLRPKTRYGCAAPPWRAGVVAACRFLRCRCGAGLDRKKRIEANGDAAAWQAGPFVELFGGAPIHYRSKWYVLRGASPVLFGFGVHGQFLLVDRRNRVVIAKFSSQELPLDAQRILLSLRLASIMDALKSSSQRPPSPCFRLREALPLIGICFQSAV